MESIFHEMAQYENCTRSNYFDNIPDEKFNRIFCSCLSDPLLGSMVERGFYRRVKYVGAQGIDTFHEIDALGIDSPRFDIKTINFENDDAIWIMDRLVEVKCNGRVKLYIGRNYRNVGRSWNEVSNILKDMLGSNPKYFNEFKRIFDEESVGYKYTLITDEKDKIFDSDNIKFLNLINDTLHFTFTLDYKDKDTIKVNTYVLKMMNRDDIGILSLESERTCYSFDINRYDIYCGIIPPGFTFSSAAYIDDEYDYYKKEEEIKMMLNGIHDDKEEPSYLSEEKRNIGLYVFGIMIFCAIILAALLKI